MGVNWQQRGRLKAGERGKGIKIHFLYHNIIPTPPVPSTLPPPRPVGGDFVRKTILVRLQAHITNTNAARSLTSLGCRCARFSQHKFSRSCSLGYIRTHKEGLAGGEKVRKVVGRAGDQKEGSKKGRRVSFASGDWCGALGVKFFAPNSSVLTNYPPWINKRCKKWKIAFAVATRKFSCARREVN